MTGFAEVFARYRVEHMPAAKMQAATAAIDEVPRRVADAMPVISDANTVAEFAPMGPSSTTGRRHRRVAVDMISRLRRPRKYFRPGAAYIPTHAALSIHFLPRMHKIPSTLPYYHTPSTARDY